MYTNQSAKEQTNNPGKEDGGFDKAGGKVSYPKAVTIP